MTPATFGTAFLFSLMLALSGTAFAQDNVGAPPPAGETGAPADATPEDLGEQGPVDLAPDAQPGAPVDPAIAPDLPDERAFTDAETDITGERWGNLPELPFVGVPVQGGIGFQPASSELTATTHTLANYVDIVMILIVVFVLALIAIAAVRFNHKANPTPARFTHNTRVEIAWTLVPVLILIAIGSFSLPVLFRQLAIPEDALTIKITGQQWFWTVEYPDNEFGYQMFLLEPDQLEEYGYEPDHYLLATDTAMVVPVDTVVKVQMTAADVIHAFAMPSFGLKLDAIPGRLNELWFNPTREGVYFGQCSELCGLDHAYMPITMVVVSQEEYVEWLDWAIDEYGGTRPEPEVAAAN